MIRLVSPQLEYSFIDLVSIGRAQLINTYRVPISPIYGRGSSLVMAQVVYNIASNHTIHTEPTLLTKIQYMIVSNFIWISMIYNTSLWLGDIIQSGRPLRVK